MTIDSIISEFSPPGKLEEGLPKYRLKYGTRRLNEALTKLGMVVAFDGEKANFRGIAKVEPQNFFISFTYYKAVVEVNEVWTEATAVTNVRIGITAMPVYDKFIVNRPFFVIRNDRSGSILLMVGITDRACNVIG